MAKKKAGDAKKRLGKKEMKKTKGGFGVIINRAQVIGGVGASALCGGNSAMPGYTEIC